MSNQYLSYFIAIILLLPVASLANPRPSVPYGTPADIHNYIANIKAQNFNPDVSGHRCDKVSDNEFRLTIGGIKKGTSQLKKFIIIDVQYDGNIVTLTPKSAYTIDTDHHQTISEPTPDNVAKMKFGKESFNERVKPALKCR